MQVICVAMNVVNVVGAFQIQLIYAYHVSNLCIAVNHGYGRPSFDVPEDDLKIALEVSCC